MKTLIDKEKLLERIYQKIELTYSAQVRQGLTIAQNIIREFPEEKRRTKTMILIDKADLLNALNTEIDENAELGDVIKLIVDFEKYHSVIRSNGRPIIIIHDQVAYLTEEHIEALEEYEKKKMHEELTNRIIANIEEIKELDGVFPSIKKLEPDGEMNGTSFGEI